MLVRREISTHFFFFDHPTRHIWILVYRLQMMTSEGVREKSNLELVKDEVIVFF